MLQRRLCADVKWVSARGMPQEKNIYLEKQELKINEYEHRLWNGEI